MRRVLVTLAALVVTLIMAGAARPELAATPIGRMDLPWWKARFDAKAREIATGRYDLVFYGDSITQNLETDGAAPHSAWRAVWDRFYAPLHALNLGFKGDTTASLLWRLDHGEARVRGVAGDPRLAVVLIGANNLGRVHWGAAPTIGGIAAVIDELHARLPRTHVLLLGVLPSVRSDWISATTRTINAGLMARYGAGQDPRVTYMDAGRVLLRGGIVDRALFVDPDLRPPDPPLHPNGVGMTLLARAIAPEVARWVGRGAVSGTGAAGQD